MHANRPSLHAPDTSRNGHPPEAPDNNGTAPPYAAPSGHVELVLPARDSLRRQMLLLAARLLAGTDASSTAPLTVIVERAGNRVEFTALPGELTAVLPGNLSPAERKVLGVATDQPQQAKVLASKAGYRLNSYFRGILRGLCRRDPPLLERVGNDYHLTTR
jgi:hypothetical protein